MYVSRLNFRTKPGKSGDLEQQLGSLVDLINGAGGDNVRVLRSHFVSPGAPDIILEQDAPDMETLESQIASVTDSEEFQNWTGTVSSLLLESPQREIFAVRTQR